LVFEFSQRLPGESLVVKAGLPLSELNGGLADIEREIIAPSGVFDLAWQSRYLGQSCPITLRTLSAKPVVY